MTERANSGGSARWLSDIVIVKYQKFGGVVGVCEVVSSHLLPNLTLTLALSTNQKPRSEASPAPRPPRKWERVRRAGDALYNPAILINFTILSNQQPMQYGSRPAHSIFFNL